MNPTPPCQSVRDDLSPYLAGDLESGHARVIADHLAHCAACRAEQAALESLDGLVTALPRLRPSAAADLRIREAVHASLPRAPRTDFGPVLDADDLAEYLHVDRLTIEVCLDELPAFEFGGKLLFRKASVDAWIERKERTFAGQLHAAIGKQEAIETARSEGGVTWTL